MRAAMGCLPHPLLRATNGVLALALTSGAAAQSDKPLALQKVEIRAGADALARKDASAARYVLGRDELDRFGDTTLADVLRRVPGVTVGGTGEAADIRLRGLGAGYTRMLVNGEPLPEGFALGALSPDVIERIEVIRTATADMSAQSIAGAINIVLKRSAPKRERSVKVHAGSKDGLGSGGVAAQWGASHGDSSHSLGSTLDYENARLPFSTALRSRDSQGAAFRRTTDTLERNTQWKLDLVPRWNWQPGSRQQLGIDGLLQLHHLEYRYDDARRDISGSAPAFMTDTLDIANDLIQTRATLHWKSWIGPHGRFESKLTLAANRRESDASLDGFDGAGRTVLARTITSTLRDNSLLTSGKYALGVTDKHMVSVGWDGQHGRRSEDRIQREISFTAYPTQDLDEAYDASISRLAVYAQDEWHISPRLSAYLGMRWEGLRTRTTGKQMQAVSSRLHVLSPTSQLLWKMPSTRGDQMRIAIGRTYKAPTTKDLIPRRWVVTDNSASTPNFQGNPYLLPELSWGLDVGYEHYAKSEGQTGFAGINVYLRQIDNVLQERIYQQDGIWISTPQNNGKGHIQGIELEGKTSLRDWSNTAPKLDLRGAFTRNWSSLDAIPGPGNRVTSQPSHTLSLGIDYRPRTAGATLGASFNLERGVFARSSLRHSTKTGNKRLLDLYGLVQIGQALQLRLTLSNILRPDGLVETRYDDGLLMQEQLVTTASQRSIRLMLEKKL